MCVGGCLCNYSAWKGIISTPAFSFPSCIIVTRSFRLLQWQQSRWKRGQKRDERDGHWFKRVIVSYNIYHINVCVCFKRTNTIIVGDFLADICIWKTCFQTNEKCNHVITVIIWLNFSMHSLICSIILIWHLLQWAYIVYVQYVLAHCLYIILLCFCCLQQDSERRTTSQMLP